MTFKQKREYFSRIINDPSKGNTHMAVKNSIYQTAITFVSRFGALIFTFVLAKIMLPEIFGLYSLALSTILLFSMFSDLGVAQTFIKYVSNALGKNKNSEAKAYAFYLAKIKIALLLIASLILIITAKFISSSIYNKPIFLALISGSIYIIFIGLVGFGYLFFQSISNFKYLLFSEIILQLSRLILIPLIVIYSLKHFASLEVNSLVPILTLGVLWFILFILLLVVGLRQLLFLKSKSIELSAKKKKEILGFVFSTSALSLSGLTFGFIDMVFLGAYVSSAFIGYYRVAATIIGSIAPLMMFSGVLLPIFSRLTRKRLESGMNKSFKVTLYLSIIATILVIILAPQIISLFGSEYSQSVLFLRILSPLLISLPLISVYSSYFIAKSRPRIVSVLLVVSTVLSIALNYLFAIYLSGLGEQAVAIGIAISIIISSYVYLFGLVIKRRSN